MGAATIHRRFPACPVARAHRAGSAADSGAYSAAEVATAAAATGGAEEMAASDAEAWDPDQAVDREDAAAAADDETRHCAERTRVAQRSSDPNNPRC